MADFEELLKKKKGGTITGNIVRFLFSLTGLSRIYKKIAPVPTEEKKSGFGRLLNGLIKKK